MYDPVKRKIQADPTASARLQVWERGAWSLPSNKVDDTTNTKRGRVVCCTTGSEVWPTGAKDSDSTDSDSTTLDSHSESDSDSTNPDSAKYYTRGTPSCSNACTACCSIESVIEAVIEAVIELPSGRRLVVGGSGCAG
jgi:hypothetical protein